MPYMGWTSLLNSPTRKEAGSANGGAGSSSALNTLTAAPPFVLPANFIQEGSSFTLKAWGVFSNTGTPTLLLGFYYGGVAGVALGTTGAITTTTGVTNVPWRISLDVDCWSDGATGTVKTQGTAWFGTAVGTWETRPIPNTANTGTVTIDTTGAKEIAVGGQWGTANASNVVTCHGFKIFSDGV